MNKCDRSVDSNQQQHSAEGDAGITSQALRALSDRNAPIDEKQPDAIRQVPDRSSDTDYVDYKDRHHAKLTRDDVEGFVRMSCHRHVVQTRNHPEAEIEHVKSDEEE